MGFFLRRTKPTADLAAVGIRCRATVEHADMLGRGSSHLSLSEGKAESILRGDETPLRFKVRLRVEPEAGEPYVVKAKVAVPVMKAGRLRAGTVVEALVDAKDKESLAIDWVAREADAGRDR
jgi:hypothetical protein